MNPEQPNQNPNNYNANSYQEPTQTSQEVKNIIDKKIQLKKINASFKNRLYRLSNTKWVATGIVVLFIPVFLMFVYSLIFLFNIDANFLNVGVSGYVRDEDGNSVSIASIYLDGEKVAETNSEGYYSYSQKEGEYNLEVIVSGFDKLEKNEIISNGFLDYSISKNYTLSNSRITLLTGKFIAEDNPSYNFVNDRVIVDTLEYKIETDGTFEVPNVEVGQVDFKFSSPNYIDIERQLELTPSDTVVSDIIVEPAGDIVGVSKNHITQQSVTDVDFQVENVSPDKISILEDGSFRIKDLEIGATYQIRTMAEGYVTRDYEIQVSQGNNQLLSFNMVPSSRFIFVDEDEEGDLNLFSSDYDGQNLKQLTIDEDLEPYNYYFDAENAKVYFQSQKDEVDSTYRGDVGLVYEFDLNTNKLIRITNISDNFGVVIPNYELGLTTNIWENDDDQHIFEYLNLDGSARREIDRYNTQAVVETFIRDSGNKIFYTLRIDDEISVILYDVISNTNTQLLNGETIQVLDISTDGKRVLYAEEDAQEFINLKFIDTETNETRNLVTNALGSNYQFVSGKNNEFIYLDEINDRTDLYRFNIDSNSTNQITRVSATEQISRYFQQNNLVFYTTNAGVYVLSLDTPIIYRKVIERGINIP